MEELENKGAVMENNELGATADGASSGIDNAPEVKAGLSHDEESKSASPEAVLTINNLQEWADRALHFLSHASNETLGACIVGLGASTYLILGRVGLVLIGVVGGIALHATWEGGRDTSADRSTAIEKEVKKRRELGLEVVDRVWKWRSNQTEDEAFQNDKHEVKLYSGKVLDFSTFDPATSAALDTFTTAIIRDYVKYEFLTLIHSGRSLMSLGGGMHLCCLEKSLSPPLAVRH